MNRPITLGLVQFQPKLADIETNVNRIINLTSKAAGQGAEYVIFPEMALTGYFLGKIEDQLLDHALTTSDPQIRRLAQVAGDHHIYLIIGFIEKRIVPGIVYNSIVIFNPGGSVLTTYTKTHLFANENKIFRAGSNLQVYQTNFGIVGSMICMDVGYPEVARVLCLQGAELLLVSSAWIEEDKDMWELSLRARALDNLVFVAGANLVGQDDSLRYIGQSMVINPRGHILKKLGNEEDILIHTIDLSEVEMVRRKALHWTGRRPELYSLLTQL